MRLLLLAGTGEARLLAERLAKMQGVDAVASLAGATRTPAKLACRLATEALAERGVRTYLRKSGIEAGSGCHASLRGAN